MTINLNNVNLTNLVITTESPPANTTELLFHFDEANGSDHVYDVVQNAFFNFSGQNGATSDTFQLFGPCSFKMGGGLSEGIESYTGTVSKDWTLEFSTFWPAINHGFHGGGLLYLAGSGSNPQQTINIFGDGTNPYSFTTAQTNPSVAQVSSLATLGVWVSWAIVFNSADTSISVYNNGTRVYNAPAPDWDWTNGWSWASIQFGLAAGYPDFFGDPIYTDEMRLSHAALYTGSTYTVPVAPFVYP
jgi:hypothetical protein